MRSATAPAEGSIDALGYASTSTGYVIGHDAEAALVKTLLQTCRVPVESTSTAAVTALRALAVERVALLHPPWFGDELNQMGATYFRDQGFDVTAADVADLPVVAGRIEPTDVIDWITHHLTSDTQAVFFGGNGFRVASAIHRLERQIGRPVLTSNQVLLWSLLGQTCAGIEVPGHGMLFQQTHPPPGQ